MPVKGVKTEDHLSAVEAILRDCIELHERKSHDYAKSGDRYSNFRFAARLSRGFTDPVDRVFATMIGIKVARLQELLNGKSPKNESLADSFKDLTTYSAIWGAWHNEVTHKAVNRDRVKKHEEVSARKPRPKKRPLTRVRVERRRSARRNTRNR